MKDWIAYVPSFEKDWIPSFEKDWIPSFEKDWIPSFEKDWIPSFEKDWIPSFEKDWILPLRKTGYLPLRKTGYLPLRKTGYLPLRKTGYLPLRKTGYLPLRKTGYLPLRKNQLPQFLESLNLPKLEIVTCRFWNKTHITNCNANDCSNECILNLYALECKRTSAQEHKCIRNEKRKNASMQYAHVLIYSFNYVQLDSTTHKFNHGVD